MATSWKEIEEEFKSGETFLPKELLPFVQLAAKDEKLGSLFPFTSHQALGFSKVEKYPHTKGLPFVVFQDGEFQVQTEKREVKAKSKSAEFILASVKEFCRAVV